MQFDVMASSLPLADMQAIAKRIEDSGLDGIWLTEGGRTAYLSCAAAALATQRVTLGTAIALAFPRSPMITAQVAWELAQASHGRFVLGLGTQIKPHIERRFSMPFDPPGPRLREYVLALKAIFQAFQTKSDLKFEGEYYRHELWGTTWNPGPIDHPDLPVYVSAVRPWMCRMAGEVADGLHFHPFHSPEYIQEQMLPHIQAGVDKAGRHLAEVMFVIPSMICVGDTDEELAKTREHARMMIAFYGTTRAYASVFEQHGYDDLCRQLHSRQKAGDFEGQLALVTDEVLDNYVVTATWDNMAEVLAARYRGLAPSMRLMTYTAMSQMSHNPDVLDRWGAVAQQLNSLG